MSTFRVLSMSVTVALAAIVFAATSTVASAGPFAGLATTKAAKGAVGTSHKVHYRRKYHKHRKYRRARHKRRYSRRYRGRRIVRAPFTHVETGRRVIVDAPFASVYVGRGVHVRAPFVNLWVPRTRSYGYRYY